VICLWERFPAATLGLLSLSPAADRSGLLVFEQGLACRRQRAQGHIADKGELHGKFGNGVRRFIHRPN
jgi:hypothetical protein